MASDSHISNWDLLIWSLLNRSSDGNPYPVYSQQSALALNPMEINSESAYNQCGWPASVLIELIELIIVVAAQSYSAENSIESEPKINNIQIAENESSCSYCKVCQKSFANQHGLKQHVGKKHCSKKRAHKCGTCFKKFYTKYILKTHIQNVHINK